ncbi:MAG: thioredoxin-dependent thiol peroxidase [Micavibrio sp.]|nr:thioredoxin-dependent thiol peroxidase [Micavibrio sp.]
MKDLSVGDVAPQFNLPADNGQSVNLEDYRGKSLILYFYPKDNTPGCTQESCDFNDALSDFERLDAAVIGISKCSVKKHENFKAKYGFKFPLASDQDADICERYGVWKEKNMYGKKFMGIERSTFLINPEGNIEKIWRKVKVKGHVEDVQKSL